MYLIIQSNLRLVIQYTTSTSMVLDYQVLRKNYKYVLLGTAIQGESGPMYIDFLLYNFLLKCINNDNYNDYNDNDNNKYKQTQTRYNEYDIFISILVALLLTCIGIFRN